MYRYRQVPVFTSGIIRIYHDFVCNVILGGFGTDNSSNDTKEKTEQKPVKSGNAEDAAFLMKNASSVIIVPVYVMVLAQAQHDLR